MKKTTKTIITSAAILCALVLLSWIASVVFLVVLKLDYSQATPLTVYQYAISHNANKHVQDALFIAVLVCICVIFLILAGVKNINRESQFGKAKWATLQSLTKAGLMSGDGIILGKFQGKTIQLAGEQFAMVAAPTRSGKGVGIVIPNLFNWPDSCVVLDTKFENYEITSGFRQKHGQKTYLFNPVPRDYKTHRYNPLGYISEDKNHRIDDVQKIANFLLPTPKQSDPMWSSEGRDLFFGIVMLILDVEEFPVTMGEVLRQLKTEQETAEYLADTIAKYKEVLSPQCISALSNFINKPSKERSGVKSTLTSALNLWSNPIIDAATSENDFDLRAIRKQRMTIYIGVTPDNLKRLAPIINMFVQQLIDLNTQELPAKYDAKGKLLSGNEVFKYQCLLLLDEFPAIGRIEILESAIAFIAGYGLRLLTIIQAPSQLRSIYGADVAETLQKNHAANIIFRPEKMKEAEEVANELGFKTVTQTSVTSPRGFGSGHGTKSKSETKRQLLLPQEIRELKDDQSIIITSGCPPIMAKKLQYYNDKVFMKRIMEKVAVPMIETVDTVLRGENDDLDLSFIYDTVPVPENDNRELTETEIETAASSFFDMLVEQSELTDDSA